MSTSATIAWLGVVTLLLGLAALHVRDRDRRRRVHEDPASGLPAPWPWAARVLLVAAAVVLGVSTWLTFG